MTTPFTATDTRLAAIKTLLNGINQNAFTDFLKIVNASPKFQQQLSDFLSVQTAPNSAITGNTISSSPGGQISQKGEYVNPNTNQTNLDGAKINLRKLCITPTEMC